MRRLSIPIVFISRNCPHYVGYALRQAKRHNDGADIHLVSSDPDFSCPPHVQRHSIAIYSNGADAFAADYVHIAVNPYDFELFCFQRWFILLEFMEQNEIDLCFCADTDVLLYCNVTDIYPQFGECDYTALHHKHFTSLHSSYIHLKVVRDFCSFLMNYYRTKRYTDIITDYPPGSGIRHFSDMYAFCLFEKECKWRGCDYDQFAKGFMFSHVVYPERICWKQSLPIERGANIRHLTLHCQGGTKFLMPLYYNLSAFPLLLDGYLKSRALMKTACSAINRAHSRLLSRVRCHQ